MPIPDNFLRAVHAVSVDDTAAEAARRMRDERVGAVLVLDAEGRAAGIVTDRDLALRVVGARLDPSATPVAACMSSPLVSLHPSESLEDAAKKMRERLVRRLPILDVERRPIGLVAADDLIASLGTAIGALAGAPAQGFENEGRSIETSGSVFGKE